MRRRARPSARSPRSPRSSSRASTPRSTRMLPAGSDLRGRVAIANAHRAYARYRERFADARWHALRERRRSPAATAVGEHRHQGPRLLRRALRRGADRPRRHQHDARGNPARVRRPRRRRSAPIGEDSTAAERDPPPSRRRRASTSTRSPPSSNAKACARSATPTTSCSPASRPRFSARPWPRSAFLARG